jgi:hypothetical protein
MEFNFITPVNAFGYDFVEPTTPISASWPAPFIDSTFVVSAYSNGTKLKEYTFTPINDIATFFGISSSQTFDKVIIQETVGDVDDEVYGKLYLKRNTTSTPSSTGPQLGACCPPGSAWNSEENRCIPTTCGEGQFYCAAQKKCLAG